jgi:hypothetical protein
MIYIRSYISSMKFLRGRLKDILIISKQRTLTWSGVGYGEGYGYGYEWGFGDGSGYGFGYGCLLKNGRYGLLEEDGSRYLYLECGGAEILK